LDYGSAPMRPRSWPRRLLVAAVVIAIIAGAAAGGYFGGRALFGPEAKAPAPPAPAPRIVLRRPKPQAAQDLGFPAFATKDTTRVGGADAADAAAGVALAAHPSAGGISGPPAVSLVPATDWQVGIAAASLTAAPVGAPILISETSGVPAVTTDALRALAPTGSKATDGNQLFTFGPASAPRGPKTLSIGGSNPAALAAAIARLRQKLTGTPPDAFVVASSTDPAYAMPAAAWAARSGDPVLFAGPGVAPAPTLRELHRNPRVPAYVLGPPSAVSDRALALIRKVAPGAKRIAAQGPVASSIAFARYSAGSFGWNINDPGHGFVVASNSRPLDAAAAAPLSASGTWGPLLVTTSSTTVPAPLRNYLLDLKPGYRSDPTRAVYNHIWVIGDASASSVGVQAQLDDLAEAAKIGSPGP
jgi:putative cell wall binding repeat protein